jgi:hypothetical protein
MGYIPSKQLQPVKRESLINTNIIKLLCLTEIYNLLWNILLFRIMNKIYKITSANSGDIMVLHLQGSLNEIHTELCIQYTA